MPNGGLVLVFGLVALYAIKQGLGPNLAPAWSMFLNGPGGGSSAAAADSQAPAQQPGAPSSNSWAMGRPI